MFAFTKEQLEAQVASILEGTNLLATVRRGSTGLLLVEVSLPFGFCLLDEPLYKEHFQDMPVLGKMEAPYVTMVVVKTEKPIGFSGYLFEFSPWIEDYPWYESGTTATPLDEACAVIEAFAGLFRISI